MRNIRQPRAIVTREKIIRAAGDLFALKGYHNTKLEEVRRVADVSTGAFFHHFVDKEDLGFAVLKCHMERRRQELDRLEEEIALVESDGPLAKVFRRLAAVGQMIAKRKLLEGGCIIGNLSASLSDTHEAFRTRLAECFDEMAAEFRPHLEQAIAERAVERLQLNMNARSWADQHPTKPDAWELARHIIAVIEGAILLARTYRDPHLVTASFENLKHHLRRTLQ